MSSRKVAEGLKWPKKLAYGNRLKEESRKAELTIKLLWSRSGWSVGQIKRARNGDHISFTAGPETK
jgi:hypothetical protein